MKLWDAILNQVQADEMQRAELREQARREYASILSRKDNCLPGDAARLLELLPVVFPLDGSRLEAGELFVRPEERDSSRWALLRKDLEHTDDLRELRARFDDAKAELQRRRLRVLELKEQDLPPRANPRIPFNHEELVQRQNWAGRHDRELNEAIDLADAQEVHCRRLADEWMAAKRRHNRLFAAEAR